MTKKGFVIFLIVFAIVFTLFHVYIFNTPFTLNLIIRSVLSGILSLGIIYIIQKYKK